MYKIVQILNVFFSETAGAVFTRFHMGPNVERMLPVCSNGSAPLNKMATMSIYGLPLQNEESFGTEFWYIASLSQA